MADYFDRTKNEKLRSLRSLGYQAPLPNLPPIRKPKS